MKKRNNKTKNDLNEYLKKDTEIQNNHASIFEKTLKNLRESGQVFLILSKVSKQRTDCPEEMYKATRTILAKFVHAYGRDKDFRLLN